MIDLKLKFILGIWQLLSMKRRKNNMKKKTIGVASTKLSFSFKHFSSYTYLVAAFTQILLMEMFRKMIQPIFKTC